MIDVELLKKYKDAFILYEIDNDGVDPRETLEGTILRSAKGIGEGYKYSVFDKLHAEIEKGGPYFDAIVNGISYSNLVDYHQKIRITEKIGESEKAAAEKALTMLYETDGDEEAFKGIVKVLGGSFDLIGLCFFIKDRTKYLPVRSGLFDVQLARIGVDSKLAGNCTWEKYNEFLGYVSEIRDYLSETLNSDITLLDAHSFLWILSRIEDYTSMQSRIVEHKTYGKGIVTDEDNEYIYVRFGKEEKQFIKNVVFGKDILKFVQDDTDLKGILKEGKFDTGISKDEWINLLNDTEVFYDKNLDLLKRIYSEVDHATTCYDLSVQDGVHPTSYIPHVVSLAKRIAKKENISEITLDNGGNTWWPILFWGRVREDGHFEWRLQPELADAIAELYPELDYKAINDELDDKLVEDLSSASLKGLEPGFKYRGVPKEKPEPVLTKGHKTYPRDRGVAANALSHANFKCEIDSEHPTFIRRSSNKEYTESHHLVPMEYSARFEKSLDVEENIVSLCSNCHNEIHYGRDANELVEKLYFERKAALESVGIVVTIEELLEMYK